MGLSRVYPRLVMVLADAFGFEEAEFVGPFFALVFGDIRVGEEAAAGAVDERLESLVATGFLDSGRDVIGDQFKYLVEVELGIFSDRLGFELGSEGSETSS